MNKLTIAACAAICATSVFAAEAITSANVVGYATKTADKKGFAVFTPMFQNVDSTKNYSIQDIKPVSGFDGYGDEEIQVLDAIGNVSASYTYWNSDMMPATGWYDGNKLATREIKNGESFLVYNPTANNFALQFAGQVNYVKTSVTASRGFSVIGNATPVDVSIQKFLPIYGFEGNGDEEIQILDDHGDVCESFTWWNADMMPTQAWYKGDQVATRVIKAGEGFLITSQAETYSITIPAVEK